MMEDVVKSSLLSSFTAFGNFSCRNFRLIYGGKAGGVFLRSAGKQFLSRYKGFNLEHIKIELFLIFSSFSFICLFEILISF